MAQNNTGMNFERGKSPKEAMRIGRAIKMLWVSMGAGASMKDESVVAMIMHWQKTGTAPSGVYPNIERLDGTRSFVEPIELSGELIEWNGNLYQLP